MHDDVPIFSQACLYFVLVEAAQRDCNNECKDRKRVVLGKREEQGGRSKNKK